MSKFLFAIGHFLKLKLMNLHALPFLTTKNSPLALNLKLRVLIRTGLHSNLTKSSLQKQHKKMSTITFPKISFPTSLKESMELYYVMDKLLQERLIHA